MSPSIPSTPASNPVSLSTNPPQAQKDEAGKGENSAPVAEVSQAPQETIVIAQLPGKAEAPTVDLQLDSQTPSAESDSVAKAKPVAELAKAEPVKTQPPAHKVTVSSYGPGLYGNKTANGTRLSPNTIGVAHKTLPLGTKVEITVNGKTVPAKVIDRGPYVHGRDFDLTTGLIKKLGFANCDIFGIRKVLVRIHKH